MPVPSSRSSTPRLVLSVALLLSVFLLGCGHSPSHETASFCDPEDGGLTLPEGFCATVVADSLGPTRHLTVADNGDVYAAVRERTNGGGLYVSDDENGTIWRIAYVGTEN